MGVAIPLPVMLSWEGVEVLILKRYRNLYASATHRNASERHDLEISSWRKLGGCLSTTDIERSEGHCSRTMSKSRSI